MTEMLKIKNVFSRVVRHRFSSHLIWNFGLDVGHKIIAFDVEANDDDVFNNEDVCLALKHLISALESNHA